jgi:phage tail-like protein
VQNEAGQTVLRYLIKRAWVSEYQALSDLDGSGKSVLISMIKVENEGWMRIPLPPPKEK